MDQYISKLLAEYLINLGDDEIILAHRDSEWCGHAPILEEDIAFANIAIDELGHARVWYELASTLLEQPVETYPDQLTYFRDASEWKSLQIVSLPNGDWAFTILRQYLYDSFDFLRVNQLRNSKYAPVAEAAHKLFNEETYHLRHTKTWLPRLANGTEESANRMQTALNEIWPYTFQFFVFDDSLAELQNLDLIPDMGIIEKEWENQTMLDLEKYGLSLPENYVPVTRPRTQQNENLMDLLSELQMVARANPDAAW